MSIPSGERGVASAVLVEVTNSATCRRCGTELAGGRLSCPVCHALVHAEALQNLVAEARQREAAEDLTAALASWEQALRLVPPGSAQHSQISAHATALERRVAASTATATSRPSGQGGRRGLLATAGAVGLALLAKGKFLLLGLTKAGTLFTMLLSFGVYWTAYGWPFAGGLVLSIYIHEMGHMAALRRFGMKTGGPMFLPGIGAVIRLQQHFASAAEDARVGLAGPLWGLGASLAAFGGYALTREPIWAAIATTGAWINLFNLLPVWQLDGGRAFRALGRGERWLAVGALGAAYLWTDDKLLLLLGLAAIWRALEKPDPASGDRPVLLYYCALAVVLALLSSVAVPTGGAGLR